MKNQIFKSVVLSIFLFTFVFAQDNNEKENVEAAATHFLNAATNQTVPSSDMIATESLDKSKEMYLKMAFDYDSTGTSNAMMLLPGNKIESMSSAEVWDHIHKLGSTMEKLDMNIEWNIEKTEIKENDAFVTYDVKGREQKVMQLKKENGKWKVVLSFGSIF
ncbi:MAG TPA: hypothetical protein DHV28_16195 [Ignavibacteriales bacterium]|nr:hypothetical protein [Ignavibacteriales bacterium]